VPALFTWIQDDPRELEDLVAFIVTRTLGKHSDDLADLVMRGISKTLGSMYEWPGNVRELEQCVRRIMINQTYEGDYSLKAPDLMTQLTRGLKTFDLSAQKLLSGYCALLYQHLHTFEAVSRVTKLDRRTVKKYIMEYEKKGY